MSQETPLTLARKFLSATVDVWGCEREKVNEVLRDVQSRGAHREFAEQLWHQSTYDSKLREKYHRRK